MLVFCSCVRYFAVTYYGSDILSPSDGIGVADGNSPELVSTIQVIDCVCYTAASIAAAQ